MMQKIKVFFQTYIVQQVLVIFLLAYFLPQLGSWLDWRDLNLIIWIYFLLNGGYALYFGWQVRQRGLMPAWLLLQPLVFAGLTTFLLDLVSVQYGYYFSAMYLILSLFTFFSDTRDDPDENMIPVENGFQDLKD